MKLPETVTTMFTTKRGWAGITLVLFIVVAVCNIGTNPTLGSGVVIAWLLLLLIFPSPITDEDIENLKDH